VNYVRIYADESGDTHFDDAAVELALAGFAPPAPPLLLSDVMPATGCLFISFPVGWIGEWHPTPRRQLLLFLAGEVEAEVGDGERRRFGTGSAVLLEDLSGKGHRSWTVGDVDALAVAVQFPD
jgi:hypothetical protein